MHSSAFFDATRFRVPIQTICCLALMAGLLSAQEDTVGMDLVQEGSSRYYGSLSLAELIDMKTSVASMREERSSDAPGAVTVYAAQDISTFQAQTLRDLGDMTPGYSISEREGTSIFETRGGVSSKNDKHLILIDNIPINHTRNNTALIDHQLPLLFANNVEFLRGPASALYGIGAFNGVVNIIPKSLKQDGVRMEAAMGVFTESGTAADIDRRKREIIAHTNKYGGFVIGRSALANSVARRNGTEIQLGYGYYSRPTSSKYGALYDPGKVDYLSPALGPEKNDDLSHFGRFQATRHEGPLAGLGFGFIGMYRQHGYGISWTGWSPEGNMPGISNYQTLASAIPYVRFDRALNSMMRLNSYAKFNFSQEKGLQANSQGWWGGWGAEPPVTGIFNFDVMTNNFEFKTHYAADFSDFLGIDAGINFDMRGQDSTQSWTQASAGNAYDRLYDKIAYTYSGFLQARSELPVLNGLIITAGARSDNGNLQGEVYNNVSPRCAAVLRIMDYLNAKVLYATALKAPGQDNISHNKEKHYQLDIYNDTTSGPHISLKSLKPEIINSLEGNLTFSMNRLYLSGTLFYNTISQTILRTTWFEAANKNLSDYDQNADNKTYAVGAEAEGRAAVQENLRFWFNAAYTKT